MLAGTIYNVIVDTLQNNATLTGYIKYVFKGGRNNIEPDSMPCIIVEPVSNNEIELDINQHKKIWMTLDVLAYSQTPENPDLGIVGDVNYKGVLDIEQDIKACLQSSNTLGDRVIDVQFEPTTFEYSFYPVRGLLMPVRINYQQTDNL